MENVKLSDNIRQFKFILTFFKYFYQNELALYSISHPQLTTTQESFISLGSARCLGGLDDEEGGDFLQLVIYIYLRSLTTINND